MLSNFVAGLFDNKYVIVVIVEAASLIVLVACAMFLVTKVSERSKV